MQRTVIYTYLGTNGTIVSSVHLEGIYSVQSVRLVAAQGKILTDGKRTEKIVTVPLEEEANWREIDL